jgi:hypothetical protein
MRSNSVGEMVIRELIREYQMKIDPNMRDLISFSFSSSGDLMNNIKDTASAWLKTIIATAGGIYVYRNRAALEGLGSIVADKVKTAAINAAENALNESRMISEATYDSRFDKNIESELLEKTAKSLIETITDDVQNLSEEIDIASEASLKTGITSFNNDVIKRMKLIVDMCTNTSRSYPDSLKRSFNVAGPALPDDIDDDEKTISGYMLLDVASILLYNMLIANITSFYDGVKVSIDKSYDSNEATDQKEKLTNILASSFKTLSSNLNSILTPAKSIFVKS